MIFSDLTFDLVRRWRWWISSFHIVL